MNISEELKKILVLNWKRWTSQKTLPVDAHLPDEYVPDEAQKLELYRRLARARTDLGLDEMRRELLDRFGPLPPPVERLLEVSQLRYRAEEAGLVSVGIEGRGRGDREGCGRGPAGAAGEDADAHRRAR